MDYIYLTRKEKKEFEKAIKEAGFVYEYKGVDRDGVSLRRKLGEINFAELERKVKITGLANRFKGNVTTQLKDKILKKIKNDI